MPGIRPKIAIKYHQLTPAKNIIDIPMKAISNPVPRSGWITTRDVGIKIRRSGRLTQIKWDNRSGFRNRQSH